MSITQLDLTIDLTDLNKNYQAPELEKLKAPISNVLLPVGSSFQSESHRSLNNLTLDQLESYLAHQNSESNRKSSSRLDLDDEIDDGVGDEPEARDLLQLDPRDWKNQDQYAVLGLSSLRWRATQDQIKRAHRKKVLRHHPDKKAGQAGNANDDSFFKCIAKAYEVLSDPIKRRQFDSIDEEVDDTDVPTEKEVQASSEDFLKLYRPVFEREARFSSKHPIPSLGDMNSTREEVEEFYDFWLKFDSWRSFEWKDKDANEGSDSRTEKRHIENKNRSERERRKKEDNARRRNIVETALQLDPRMKKFKAEERLAREAKKKGTNLNKKDDVLPDQLKQKQEEEQRMKLESEKKAQEEKLLKENAKKSKEAAKKAVKKEKKSIQTLIVGLNYFLESDQALNPSLIEVQLNELDLICSSLEVEDVIEMRKRIEESIGKKESKQKIKSLIGDYGKKVKDGNFKEFV
ncbi:hypothetical protein BY996DRAFT_6436138 [Phakopsora pachyrhizi]|uniref:J domain-containing protein n=1 Tax=Phakopsora pachyrhizi TaxID=170000 RepID=A0AAV0AEG3_PHAPC|nr:hypothetical protein BY996DRAFT_6436138 [Phakopsora pachyrhizi]CAH7665992.1 hypothetical protein PPACK8108_LOCUS291 [Phakopsora pachyrhizi]